MKSVAILGTGPAGLMAAHAVAMKGHPFSLFSQPGGDGKVHKSELRGAQFLHNAIPPLSRSQPDFTILYHKIGTSDGYRQKVYGSGEVPFVSFDNFKSGYRQPAWSLGNFYDQLWDTICGPEGHSVNPMFIAPHEVETLLKSFDLIISTIPRTALCWAHTGVGDKLHAFTSVTVFINDKSVLNLEPDTIMYNGDPQFTWYRTSNINGFASTEWGVNAPSNLSSFYGRITPVSKPMSHNCTCWADKPVVFAGRYGAWSKGQLTHDAFYKAWEAVGAL